jgi:TRAP-type mannitol/chloroaromatic compound transport system permease small subunit
MIERSHNRLQAATRVFGWGTLALLLGFLVNVVLNFWMGFPGALALWTMDDLSPIALKSGLQILIYCSLLFYSWWYIKHTTQLPLRLEAKRISQANGWLIRCAFWAVLLIGIADALISFIRVEGYIIDLFGDSLGKQLSRSAFRGVWLHMPLLILGVLIGSVTRGLGFIWLTSLVVLAELLIVFSRFILSYEQAFMGDLVRFWYGALFLFASAYTLQQEGHVRIDVFYASMKKPQQGRVNAIGSILLGMSLCWTIILLGMWGKSSIIVSPLLVFETTQTGSGMFTKYLMAGFLAIYAISMMIQFVAVLFGAVADVQNQPELPTRIAVG